MNNLVKKWAKDLNRHLTKDIQIADKHMKRCTPTCVRGNVDYTNSKILFHTYLNGQNLEHWQHQMLTRMWYDGPGWGGKCEQCWGECRMAATLEDRLAASYKAKHTPVIDLAFVLLVFTQRSWKLTLRKHLHKEVFSSFIHNCQNLEATKMSFNRWKGKLWYIQTVEY